MSSASEGGRRRVPLHSRGFSAKDTALRNMNVSFQMEVLQKEKEIFYQHLVETKNFLQKRIKEKTDRDTLDGWIVCGSGLASLPDFNSNDIEIIDRISTKEIPHWFTPNVDGHGKEVIIANIKGQIVGIQTGRVHIYDTDGSPQQLKMITAPLIVAKGLGVSWVVTTNAAGVLENGKIEQGDVVVDADYVNQFGVNPLMGPNDERLGTRFPGKGDVADPEIYRRLEGLIPEDNLHLGIYSLKDNAPFYEGGADVLTGIYKDLLEQNPWLVQAFGMSFAMEAMVIQHFNKHPVDVNGFDRQVHWIGLTAATNIVKKPIAPTKTKLREGKVEIANNATHEEVLEGAKDAEKYLIPAVINLCGTISANPLP